MKKLQNHNCTITTHEILDDGSGCECNYMTRTSNTPTNQDNTAIDEILDFHALNHSYKSWSSKDEAKQAILKLKYEWERDATITERCRSYDEFNSKEIPNE